MSNPATAQTEQKNVNVATKTTKETAKTPVKLTAAELKHFAPKSEGGAGHESLKGDYRTFFQPHEVRFFVDLFKKFGKRTYTRQEALSVYETGPYLKSGKPGKGCPNWFNKNYACHFVELINNGTQTFLLEDVYRLPFELLPKDAVKNAPENMRRYSIKKATEVFMKEHPEKAASSIKVKDVSNDTTAVKVAKASKAAEPAAAAVEPAAETPQIDAPAQSE